MSTKKIESDARDRIIETALNLFYTQGYLATGINQIIAESKVAKATFYAHFPSKEALCLAYLQARHILWMGWLKESVAGNKSTTEKLTGIFKFLEMWMSESNFRGCAFLNIATEIPSIDSKIRDEVIKHKDDLQAYIKDIIQALIESDSSFSELDAQQTAKIVYVLVEGAIVSSQNYSATWPIKAAQKAVKNLLKL
ncbi:MAG: TetR/AcrR family transcriptional regulator [Pseudomonadota bacterium]